LTDIVDSVALWERDPNGMSVAVARHDEIVADAVTAAGGELVRAKGEGDSTFSVFAHPVEAVASAVGVQQAIAAEAWPTGLGLHARAGVHAGDAEPRQGDWYGPAVNRAARLRALAGGAQTLVSGVTAGLVADQLPSGVRLLYRGRRTLRGIERPEEVWELVPPGDPRLAASGPARATGLPVPLTSFVGHGGDVERLVELVESERLVTPTGPGGSGKTRMALEAAGALAGRGPHNQPGTAGPGRRAGLAGQVPGRAARVPARAGRAGPGGVGPTAARTGPGPEPRPHPGRRGRRTGRICRALDGNPLAIELAAGRLRSSASPTWRAGSSTSSPCSSAAARRPSTRSDTEPCG
jgi:class 3 adenylate cyclase